MNNLIGKVLGWAMDRQLLGSSQDKKLAQLGKTTEEVGELAGAVLRGDFDEVKDGIGDVTVTLIILAQQHGLTLEQCLDHAYCQIKGRTGVTISGVFLRDDE